MIRNLIRLYATSWVLLLTHALCICIGAAWMLVAIVGDLKARGLL